METRDKYFTRLKWRIELTMKTEGEKVRPLDSDQSCLRVILVYPINLFFLPAMSARPLNFLPTAPCMSASVCGVGVGGQPFLGRQCLPQLHGVDWRG